MESTISRSGLTSLTWLRMTSRFVSVTSRRSAGKFFAPSPMRVARILICRSDSSPETYSTRLCAAISSAICSIKVDLPMPGSPPTSTMEPGTMPPPSTRANSPIGRSMRSSLSPPTCADGPRLRPAAQPADRRRALARGFIVHDLFDHAVERAALRAFAHVGGGHASTFLANVASMGFRP